MRYWPRKLPRQRRFHVPQPNGERPLHGGQVCVSADSSGSFAESRARPVNVGGRVQGGHSRYRRCSCDHARSAALVPLRAGFFGNNERFRRICQISSLIGLASSFDAIGRRWRPTAKTSRLRSTGSMLRRVMPGASLQLNCTTRCCLARSERAARRPHGSDLQPQVTI